MASLSRPLARRASGPARLRQRLGAARGRLQHAMARSHSAEGLRARLPGAVFGGDLLETLSSTLRGLLAPHEQATAASERVRPRAAAPVVPAASGARPHLASGAGRPVSQHAASPRRLSDALATRPSMPDAARVATRTRAGFDPMQVETSPGADGPPLIRAERAGHADSAWPESTAEGTRRLPVSPMAASPLGRCVSEYLALARADVQRRVATERRDGAVSRTEAVLSPPALPQHRLAWPEQLPETALDTLQKFEAAQARMPVPTDRGRTLSPHADAPLASRPARADGDPVHGHDSIRDLSVQMADVLRTQAIRHGIDLT